MHQQATTRFAAWASAVALALGVVSCSSDDAGDPLSTLTDPPTTAPPVTTATTSTTTTAVTSTQPPHTTTSPPTTPPAPETEPPVTLTNGGPPLPREIEEAVLATGEREKQLVYEFEPTAPDLDSRVGEVAEAGSRYEVGLRQTLSELQAIGARFSLSEPSINQLIIEWVSYEGGTEATVQICEISNDRVVSAADPAVVVDEFWDGRLHVARATIVIRRSDEGQWRRADQLDVEAFEGVETCPPES